MENASVKEDNTTHTNRQDPLLSLALALMPTVERSGYPDMQETYNDGLSRL